MSTATLPAPDERLLPIADAIEQVTGYRPHPTSCCRWHRRGVRGVKLRTVVFGGRPRTCEKWVREFIASTTDRRNGDHSASSTT